MPQRQVTHASGQVDHDIDIRCSNLLHKFAVEFNISRWSAGLRVTNVKATAAPALAASIADSAICSGVTGTLSEGQRCRRNRSPRR